MRAMRVTAAVLSLMVGGASVRAEPARRIAFWPDAVPDAIEQRADGAYALAAVRALGGYHRVQGSPGLRAAAAWVAGELGKAGLGDAQVEHFAADGKATYAHFPSYLGWDAQAGKLDELAPTRRVIGDFASQPVALADYSQDADVTAELVDVGAGTDAAAYQGKDVRGKLVLADGALAQVHKLAVEQRGAAGIVSDFPNQRTAWSGLDPDLVRWGHLSPYQTANKFAFMVSKRMAGTLRGELARGPVRMTAHVRAKMVAASFDVVSATIAGSDPAAGEIVLTAHLCHERAGANDNASGSAALLAAAKALAAGIAAGDIARPKRTIRFLWLPEIAGSQAWLVSHPELASKLRAGIHLDMVGARFDVTHAALHLSRTAGSLPHVINEVATAWLDDVARRTTRFAETGEGDGMLTAGGGRDALVTDVRPLELGSDHEVFEAFGVPMVYFHDWPDVTIHTHKDVPDNLDASKLGRVAYMTAGIAWTMAALPDGEASKLIGLERAAIEAQAAAARHAGRARGWDAGDVRIAEREAITSGVEELASLAALWPTTAGEVRKISVALVAGAPRLAANRAADTRIAERTPAVRGPLDVYYYAHLPAVLGDAVREAAIEKRSGVLSFEALNLVDGKRTVSEIRDRLTGRYEPVPLAEVSAWLDVLAKAGVIRWKAR